MASPVYPAKKAMQGLLETLLPGQVRWGAPTEQEDFSSTGEMVFLTDAPSAGVFNVLGGRRLDHEFTIRVVIDVRHYGDDEELAERRAFEIRDLIVPALINTPTLGLTNLRVTGITEPVAGNAPAPAQWVGQRVIDVACAAQEFFA